MTTATRRRPTPGHAEPVPPRSAPRRIPADAVLLAAAVSLVAASVKVAWPRFTWFGDNAESFFPLWHIVGSGLRRGEWLGFDPTGFSGGNTVAEAAYGLFNPVTLLNAIGISFLSELALASFLVMTEFLVLLGLGVRALARAYGAAPAAAFTAGLMVPFGGFTLFWGAGNWASGLMALTWVVWSWAAARRYVVGAGGPGALVVAVGLAVTVGNPYSLLGLAVVAVACLVDLALRRDHRRVIGFCVVGVVTLSVVVLTYGPLVHALEVAERGSMAGVSNAGYLAPSPSDLAAMSSPTLLPQFNAWSGTADLVPSVYLSWVLVPLLPWLRRPDHRSLRELAGLLTGTGLFLLMAIGPDQLWLFRWPLRLVEYTWVGVAVLFAVVLGRGLATDRRRARTAGSAVLVLAGSHAAWASTPADGWLHLAATTVLAGLLALLLAAARRHGTWGVAAVVLLGTAITAPVQAAQYAWDAQPVVPDLDLGRVSHLDAVRSATSTYEGLVLQVANVGMVEDPDATTSGALSFGHMLAAAGHETVNRYSGIGFTAFDSRVFVDYRGSVYTDVAADLVHAELPGYGTTVGDALGVSTLVVAKPGSKPSDHVARDGWHVSLDDAHRTVLVRDELLPDHPAVTPGPGVSVGAITGTGTDLRVDVTAADDGTVVLGLLAWPGYTATTDDGTPLRTAAGPLGLLEVTVPAGASQVRLEYHVPGLAPSLVAVALAGALAGAHQVVWATRRRRPARPGVVDGAVAADLPEAPGPRQPAPRRPSSADQTSIIRTPLPRPPHPSPRRTVSVPTTARDGHRDPVGS